MTLYDLCYVLHLAMVTKYGKAMTNGGSLSDMVLRRVDHDGTGTWQRVDTVNKHVYSFDSRLKS